MDTGPGGAQWKILRCRPGPVSMHPGGEVDQVLASGWLHMAQVAPRLAR